MSLNYFSQLNVTMSNHGASMKQFKDMCDILGQIAKCSRKSLYELTRFTIILFNRRPSKEEAIYQMKLFAGVR